MRRESTPPTNARSHVAVVVCCAALAVAGLGACSGDADGTPPTGSLPGIAASTTSAAEPTTTQAPTAATADVRQAVVDYWAASRACGRRPSRCRPESFTATTGTLRATVAAFVNTLIARGYQFADGASDGDGSFVSVETVTISPASGDPASGTTAHTTECVYDPTPLLGPPGADGQRTVVSVTAIPRRFAHSVYLEDGQWRVGEEQVDADTTQCSFTTGAVADTFPSPPR